MGRAEPGGRAHIRGADLVDVALAGRHTQPNVGKPRCTLSNFVRGFTELSVRLAG